MTVHSAADRTPGGDKRERILGAAERIFARHGFFAAKVSDVAKEAGVADGTIYLYFKSKDDLLISLPESQKVLDQALEPGPVDASSLCVREECGTDLHHDASCPGKGRGGWRAGDGHGKTIR